MNETLKNETPHAKAKYVLFTWEAIIVGAVLAQFFGMFLLPISKVTAWLVEDILLFIGFLLYIKWTILWREKYKSPLIVEVHSYTGSKESVTLLRHTFDKRIDSFGNKRGLRAYKTQITPNAASTDQSLRTICQ